MSDRERNSRPDSLDRQLLLEILRRLDEGQIKGLLAALQAKPELEAALRKALSLCWSGEQPYRPQQALAESARQSSGQDRTFFQELIRFVDRAEMTDPEVYRAAGLNRTLWYRLRDKPDARTSKQNVLKIGLVLHLDYLELYYLLALGGHPFAPACSGTDLVIAVCLQKGIYDPLEVDSRLYKAGEPTLFSEE